MAVGCLAWIEYLPDVPAWIEPDITCSTIAAILQGGCASGAYMPAVTYHQAAETMAEHGDDVLQYLEDRDYLGMPNVFTLEGESWSGFACKVLSAAVEAWAMDVESALEQA